MHHRAPYREFFTSSMAGLRNRQSNAALNAALSVVFSFALGGVVTPRAYAQTETTESPSALLKQASSSLRDGNMAEAARLAQKASEGSDHDAAVQQRAGELLFLSGSVQESLPRFEQANTLDEKLAPHNWQRGVGEKFAASGSSVRINFDSTTK